MFKNAASASFARASVAAVLGGAAVLWWSSAVLAADDTKKDDTKQDDDQELVEVQVTGTRILAPNVVSANPITSIGADEMQRLGIVNVADALTILVPQNISTYAPALTGDNATSGNLLDPLDRGSFFIGNTIANLRGLDPTFGTRTLTLVDGARVPSTSNQADVVDLSTIPSNLLERIDVVTGGASATYGSGAMAGVVNLVLNRRLNGVNLDMDYGITEAGDGQSPHIALSGGTSFLDGKLHVLAGGEFQDTHAIADCSTARRWCAESRTLLTNSTLVNPQSNNVNSAMLPGYGGRAGDIVYPSHFELSNVRYSQWAPTGTIYFNNLDVTSDWSFSADGTSLSPGTLTLPSGVTLKTGEYSLGFNGGNGQNAINGDGPLATSFTPLQPSSNKKSLLANLEYDFNPQTTGYLQASYAKTNNENRNPYTTGSYCVHFDTQGVAATLPTPPVQGGVAINGYAGTTASTTAVFYGTTTNINPLPPTDPAWNSAAFRTWVGWQDGSMAAPGYTAPYWIAEATAGSGNYNNGGTGGSNTYGIPVGDQSTPPTLHFTNGTVTKWIHVTNNPATGGKSWWVMAQFTPSGNFQDPGSAAVLPQTGHNSYAFLNTLAPEARSKIANSFSTGATTGTFGNIVDQTTGALLTGGNVTAGGGASTGLDVIYGPNPCSGFTAMRKVWYPQLQRYTNQVQEPWRAKVGVRGRFGSDWKWEGYVQYGKTNSTSTQNNVATNLRLAMAVDAVIDDRPGSATYGQPICRVVRDGVPTIDYQGRPLSNVADLQALAADCKPINLFGDDYSNANYFAGYNAALTQQQAIDYAFVTSTSSGWNSAGTLSFTTSGTLWDGWGAGPLTGATGVEVDQNKTNNGGTSGITSFYQRADLASAWSDAFGGQTTSTDGYVELNMPLISGVEGLNLWNIDASGRYTSYYNKGGAGTTGQHATQDVTEWKFSSVFSPFDWVRFRITRSRDMRAPTYRDLFLHQLGLPDQFSGSNPWRPYDPSSTEGRQERWGQVQVGNPALDPEKSDTLTLGLELSPGGWAQGMNFSADYYTINVKHGIYTPFSFASPITSCWSGSGNTDPSATNADITAVNGNIDYNYYDPNLQEYPCQQITFAQNPDGTPNLQDIVSYNSAHPVNGLPYQRRGMDFNTSYTFPLNRAFEDAPGSVALNLRATRAIESSGISVNAGPNNPYATQAACLAAGGTYIASGTVCNIPVDLVGQIRSNTFIPGVAASPKWSGNISAAYILGDLTTTVLMKYVGGAVLDKTWCDAKQAAQGCKNYAATYNSTGQITQYYFGAVDNNQVKPYIEFSLNGSYNLHVANTKQFQLFGSINNLFDKEPVFTGGGIGGANAQYNDTLGRAYRFGVRLRF
ncbi:MAG TPA: TonB-dependent receptor [Steroidobacteraceae bacterium]|nr:TonB-dependent receptor [Steroidobacteraceae bacterium]